jgi:PleD family two-component response regulator
LRLRVAESSLDALDGLNLPLHISIGVTPVPSSNSFATALDRADRALTRAKQNGRNGVVAARPDA